jgi:hypothetical protein
MAKDAVSPALTPLEWARNQEKPVYKLLTALTFTLIASVAQAGAFDRLIQVAAQVAVDSAQPSGMGWLVWQQAAKGPYNVDGLACTYNVDGQQLTVFKLAYCPLQLQF